MKLKNPSQFIVAGMDVQDGDQVKFLDTGIYQPLPQDPSKETLIFNVELPSGDKKKISLNNTSQTNLMKVWGDESSTWVNKTARIEIVKQKVFDKMKNVMYLYAVDAPAEKDIEAKEIPVVEDKEETKKPAKKEKKEDSEIDPSDIPF